MLRGKFSDHTFETGVKKRFYKRKKKIKEKETYY